MEEGKKFWNVEDFIKADILERRSDLTEEEVKEKVSKIKYELEWEYWEVVNRVLNI